jgi:hypothetical protein
MKKKLLSMIMTFVMIVNMFHVMRVDAEASLGSYNMIGDVVIYGTDAALWVLLHAAGLDVIPDDIIPLYDLDRDGLITTTDALMILRIIAGLIPIPEFMVERFLEAFPEDLKVIPDPEPPIEYRDYTLHEWILRGVKAHQEEIEIPEYFLNQIGHSYSSDATEVRTALVEAVRGLHHNQPLLFHYKQLIITSQGNDPITRVTVKPEYFMTPSAYQQSLTAYERRINDIVARASRGLQPNPSDYEKAFVAFSLLVRRVSICEDIDESTIGHFERTICYTAYGAINGECATCEGFTHAYGDILTRMGIENTAIRTSASYNTRHGAHIWNYIKLDGHWYHADAFANALTYEQYMSMGLPLWDSFLLTDNELIALIDSYSSTSDWNRGNLPAATSTRFSGYDWCQYEVHTHAR